MIINSQDNTTCQPIDSNAGDYGSPVAANREHREAHAIKNQRPRRGMVHFIAELRRRHVCRVATMYAIVMWLICEIVELISSALDLPEWTLKFVIVIGLLGLPIVLILSWLLDITPNGLVLEAAGGSRRSNVAELDVRRPMDRIINCGLLLVAALIGIQLAVGILSSKSIAAASTPYRVAVKQFRVASGTGAEALSQALIVELQRELTNSSQVTVIEANDRYFTPGSLSLGGVVSLDEQNSHTTITMTNNATCEITWAMEFESPRTGSVLAPVALAAEITAVLIRSPSAFVTTRNQDES